jgi:hypothetical protein
LTKEEAPSLDAFKKAVDLAQWASKNPLARSLTIGRSLDNTYRSAIVFSETPKFPYPPKNEVNPPLTIRGKQQQPIL